MRFKSNYLERSLGYGNLNCGYRDVGTYETLKKSVGMYAFALWDREEQVLYLVRDRIGEKPLTTATNMVFFFLVLN